MKLVITLIKEIDDPEEGRQLYELVKQRLADREDVTLSAHVTNHLEIEEPS